MFQTKFLAYKLFDADGDGELTPEEFSKILTSIGETPGDLNLFFSGMTTETITDFKPCVDWITFLIKHGEFYDFKAKLQLLLVNQKDPKNAEKELVASLAEYGIDNHNMSADGLFDWIDNYYPDLSEEEIDHLVDGADIDGDGNINFVAYSNIVCDKILNLNDAALEVAIWLLCFSVQVTFDLVFFIVCF